jgi:hypothetical protein
MTRWGAVLVVVALAAGAIGCESANYRAADRYERGLVLCLSGAGGGVVNECEHITEGLAKGGVDYAIEPFEWSQGGILEDQTSVVHNRHMGSQLAAKIEAYMAEHPGRPVYVIGMSAGTGVVVWALEDLSPGTQVEGAVILASSLDARYDLTQALGHVKTHLYSFNSIADTVLSLAVAVTGTVDRGGGVAGGLVGFSPPHKASEETKALYKEKLAQISWWPGDMVLGHLGDHLGAASPTYVRVKVAPLILGKEPKPGHGGKDEAPPAEKPAVTKTLVQKDSARKPGERQRFFNWHVGPSAQAPAAPPPAAWAAPGGAASQASEKIDESQLFNDRGQLP